MELFYDCDFNLALGFLWTTALADAYSILQSPGFGISPHRHRRTLLCLYRRVWIVLRRRIGVILPDDQSHDAKKSLSKGTGRIACGVRVSFSQAF